MKLKKKHIILISGSLLFVVIVILISSNWFWNSLSPVLHKDLLYKYAGEYKIDPLLVASVIKCESTFNPLATSKRGALGLMQLIPDTAEELAHELNVDYVNTEDLYSPDINIHLGYYYLEKLKNKYNGKIVFALAAYNAGTKYSDKWFAIYKGDPALALKNIEYPETRRFITNVLNTYTVLKAVRGIKRALELKD
jgi:soluble lytic murein transglycosylase